MKLKKENYKKYFVWVFCPDCQSTYIENLYELKENKNTVCPSCGYEMYGFNSMEEQ